LATAAALKAMGAKLERDESGVWRVHGVGVGGLAEPEAPLDLGNAGTATRLLMGILATHPFTSFMTGDASLRSRPMARVMTPLGQMGARFVARSGNRLPLAIIGTENPMPVSYTLPVASAQVKSAILLAGMNTPGSTTVIVPRDPSSAAFPLVAALLVENSDVTIAGVGVNPLRAGIIKTLLEMGGAI